VEAVRIEISAITNIAVRDRHQRVGSVEYSCRYINYKLAMKSSSLKQWARSLKRHIGALYLASRDARVPLPAKWIIVLVLAYALSPIDLIPDFIPVIGYLDDLLLLPLAIWLALRLVPRDVWLECQAQAEKSVDSAPPSTAGAVAIVLIWLLVIIAVVFVLY